MEQQTFHVYKGSNYKTVEHKNSLDDDEKNPLTEKRQYFKPPKPVEMKTKVKMLHNLTKSGRPSGSPGMASTATVSKFQSRAISSANMSVSFSEMEDMELESEEQRRERDILRRNIRIKNAADDKADMRDGITETKGVLMNVNSEFKPERDLQPKQKKTKAYAKLRALETEFQREKQLKEELKSKDRCSILDEQSEESDPELERHGGDDEEVEVYRRNPLELKPKEKIKKEKEDLTFETRDLLARKAERANEIRDARMAIINAKKAE